MPGVGRAQQAMNKRNVLRQLLPGDYVSTQFFSRPYPNDPSDRFGLVMYTFLLGPEGTFGAELPQACVMWSDGSMSSLWFGHLTLVWRDE